VSVNTTRDLWRCPECGWERQGRAAFLVVSESDGRELARADVCYVCLIGALNRLAPAMVRVEDPAS
jgi:hypothetical protein